MEAIETVKAVAQSFSLEKGYALRCSELYGQAVVEVGSVIPAFGKRQEQFCRERQTTVSAFDIEAGETAIRERIEAMLSDHAAWKRAVESPNETAHTGFMDWTA